jgi:hypothetical protein
MKETKTFSSSGTTTMITVTIIHDNEDLNEECERQIGIHNTHRQISVKNETNMIELMNAPSHVVCSDCFTTTIIEDYE